MRKGFTLIEMIFVIVISSTLAMGTFKAIQALYVRSAKAQAITQLSLRSQIVLDQITLMLYNRIPNSVIGYDIADNNCSPISELGTGNYTILEWLGSMDDELLSGDYDGFINMGDSNSSSKILSTPFMRSDFNDTDVNLVFAGSFDEGTEESSKACGGAFGWHTNESKLAYTIDVTDTNKTQIVGEQPEYIYEKYYLTKTAYAVARGKDLSEKDVKDNCNYDTSNVDFNTTLFLFYDYQPFLGETFCGDSQGTRSGKVSVLAEDISAFEALYINDIIRINLDSNRTIRGSQNDVHISKQKAIF